MLAAENGALPGGKVGGVGDVLRDLPLALTEAGWQSVVLTPEYGLFAGLPGARHNDPLAVAFGGETLEVDVVELPAETDRVRHIAFRHDRFQPQGPRIYCDDGPARPFASDATKFALFCAAAAGWIGRQDTPPAVVHLHDWHAAPYCLLREFHPGHEHLAGIHTVFTIHNLALQGVRPLAGDPSSLEAWFPELAAPVGALGDPRWADCVNPMAAAIRLADALSTVSPSYAREILRDDDPESGVRGGEGLQRDLRTAAEEKRLTGILNGCAYPKRDRRRPGWRRLLDTVGRQSYEWVVAGKGSRQVHELGLERLHALPRRRPRNLLTSVGRLTEQKAALYLQRDSGGARAVERILGNHAEDTVLILLGSGDPAFEQAFADIARHHDNFLFVNGYADTVADLLYRSGDLFLMPSSFEPCGISQMLAMRASQPCVAHAVGGLADTVADGVNGFSFGGRTRTVQADGFVATVDRAISIKNGDQDRWLRIRDRAQAERFSWPAAAARYVEGPYTPR